MVHTVTDTDDFFNHLVTTDKGTLVLALFRTNWAKGCKEVAELLRNKGGASLGEDEGNSFGEGKRNTKILEVMAEDCGDLAATFNIQAMPAVLVFTQGKVSAELIGKTEVVEKLDAAIKEAMTMMEKESLA